jgi:hypothetical protein
MSRYKWVHHGDARLYEVGIEADGTIYNPRGYPPDLVREAVLAADVRQHERGSRGAKKAAQTRSTRQRKKVYAIAARIAAGHSFGPRTTCVCCGRPLGDADSVARGIGSECWQEILRAIELQQNAAPGQPTERGQGDNNEVGHPSAPDRVAGHQPGADGRLHRAAGAVMRSAGVFSDSRISSEDVRGGGSESGRPRAQIIAGHQTDRSCDGRVDVEPVAVSHLRAPARRPWSVVGERALGVHGKVV